MDNTQGQRTQNGYTKQHPFRTHIWFSPIGGPFRIFYCPSCTRPLFKFRGSVATIVPGNGESDEVSMMKFPLVVLCRGEHRKYGKCPAEYVIEGFAS